MRCKPLPPAVADRLMSLVGRGGQYLVNALAPGGYDRHAGLAYGDLPRQKLDVYVPRRVPDKAPVVVFFYGGRWQEGDRRRYKFVAQALTSRGFIAVLPDYRLYPQVRFPAFVEDGALAVKWAHEHARRYGGRAGSLFVMGHSAGAHIAALLALDGEFLRTVGGTRDWLAGMVGLAGPYDFLPLEADDLRDMFGPPPRFPATQPINHVDGQSPPLLLLQGLQDRTVFPKNARNLEQAVRSRGGSVKAVYYRRKAHINIIAALAAPLRFTGTVLTDIADFVHLHNGDRMAPDVGGERAAPNGTPVSESSAARSPRSHS